VDFHNALNTVIAELTPQPWDYTTNARTTLTVIPAGLRAEPGDAEVIVRISAIGQFFDAEAGIPTRNLPGMIKALTERQPWSYTTILDVAVELTLLGGDMLLVVTADEGDPDECPQIQIPAAQRLPLASALTRALDVAHGWED
jgi:hypothetical protein